MSKYRVREQYGVFYIEKKVWLLGWVTCRDSTNRKKAFLSLENSWGYINQLIELEKPSTPIYHYQIKGSTAPVEPHREA